jgi:F-type H+-transporting ATPase subunit b
MHTALLAALVLAEEGGGEGFSSPFVINTGLFFWTWVVFIMLFLVLKKFAWPFILKATEERERRIARQLADAERMRGEAEEALAEHKRLLAGAKEEAHTLINEAKAIAQKEREQLIARAQQEQVQMLERAKREIDTERQRAVHQLRREAVELSLAAAARLIDRRMDQPADRKLVEEFIDSIGKGGA